MAKKSSPFGSRGHKPALWTPRHSAPWASTSRFLIQRSQCNLRLSFLNNQMGLGRTGHVIFSRVPLAFMMTSNVKHLCIKCDLRVKISLPVACALANSPPFCLCTFWSKGRNGLGVPGQCWLPDWQSSRNRDPEEIQSR